MYTKYLKDIETNLQLSVAVKRINTAKHKEYLFHRAYHFAYYCSNRNQHTHTHVVLHFWHPNRDYLAFSEKFFHSSYCKT